MGKRNGVLLMLLRGVELLADGVAQDVEAVVDAGEMRVVKQEPDRRQVGPGHLHGVARLLGPSPGVLEPAEAGALELVVAGEPGAAADNGARRGRRRRRAGRCSACRDEPDRRHEGRGDGTQASQAGTSATRSGIPRLPSTSAIGPWARAQRPAASFTRCQTSTFHASCAISLSPSLARGGAISLSLSLSLSLSGRRRRVLFLEGFARRSWRRGVLWNSQAGRVDPTPVTDYLPKCPGENGILL